MILTKRKMLVSCNVVFKKNVFYYQHHSPSLPPLLHPTLFHLHSNHSRLFLNVLNLGLFIDNDSVPLVALLLKNPLNLQVLFMFVIFLPLDTPSRSVWISSLFFFFFFFLSIFHVSNSFKQVVGHLCWQKAMDEELKFLIENHTWDLMPCLTNVKPIEGKWVYSV